MFRTVLFGLLVCFALTAVAAIPGDKPAAVKKTVAVASYTCPMHPEVKADKAGKCPSCGMALVTVKAKEKKDDCAAECMDEVKAGAHGSGAKGDMKGCCEEGSTKSAKGEKAAKSGAAGKK